MFLKGASGLYDIQARRLADTESYSFHLAREEESGRWHLAQIAASRKYNGGLERAAFILRRLATTAELFDAEYAKLTNHHLHYERLYPLLVESGVSPERGRRRINIYCFADVDDVRRILPMSNIRRKNGLRVDIKTSAWIMGRLLKMLAYIHGEGVQNRRITASNVLLDHQQHFAITLDWTSAFLHQDQVPADKAVLDIKDAASAVMFSLGGEVNGHWPYGETGAYIRLLQQLIKGAYSNAEEALDSFYELVRAEYGQKFHKFTTLSL
ncbi:hypothetical protein FBF31_01420 [Candidatus Saccharibacteria bacterium oral taxon 955]|nr:hypothetical protein FBF33_01415 [Candidatus Saccharibacteria bacterium oral taxon 955]QJU05740.1 hypothetical protein FBF31_01420 [Candidatus Saccharibacteria bacterium oral taxon 955]